MKTAGLTALLCLSLLVSCGKASADSGKVEASPLAEAPLVTFIELGSVNCVPCKAMQPVMDSIRQKYPDQVSVVFYDVWTDEGQPYGRQYGIRVIPTQVFLNKDGKEFFRHEGFFPEEELLKILALGGVAP
ncbi:MAG: thioredoxin [Spirochaetae bacterium HGW-Spirochaetae-3]|nr:MAG: thioredoxin [Spirochaetae bacterium HGW-Spirochaetae-3]